MDPNIKIILRELHNDLQKSCPALKTKIQRKGKTVIAPVNHFSRLEKIVNDGGDLVVCYQYCDAVVKKYNAGIAEHKGIQVPQPKISPLKAVK